MSRFQAAILGDLPAFAADPIGFVEDRMIGRAEPLMLRFGPRPFLLVATPQAVRQVLIDDRDQYGKGPEQARMRPLFGNGMITSSGARWHSVREATKFAFSSAGLQDGLHLAMRCLTQELFQLSDEVGSLVPVHRIMGRLSMRMAAAALFHTSLDEATTVALCNAGATSHRRLSETMWRLIDVDNILPTRKHRKFRKAIKDFEIISESLKGASTGIMKTLEPVAEKHGDHVFRDEAITMLVSGFETTATAACWLTYALACRPDLVEWLRPEVDAVLSRKWGITPANLKEMPRARALVQEVLRLYPSAWWFARKALTDCTVDGVPVKKGTAVLICPWALHRQPDLWPDARRLDPLRFYEKSPPDKFAYIPFGAGPRACIGQHLATVELTAIAATLVSAFELEPLSGPIENLSPYGGVTLWPPRNLAVRLHMRPQLRKVA